MVVILIAVDLTEGYRTDRLGHQVVPGPRGELRTGLPNQAHNRAVLSQLTVASRVPSGLNATPSTKSVWPVRVRKGAPVATSHSRAVLSQLTVASRVPPPGSPGWDQLVALAEAGDVELAVVVMVRDRDPLCTDRVARQFGQADPAPPAEPVSLADELRAIGLM